jgi:transcriptional regulator with XRE-family HTH domain
MVLLRRVIGDALRARRQAQHRTLREVSTAANVSLGYLSEIERGQKEASSELLAAICVALGAQLSELLREVSHTVADAEAARAGTARSESIRSESIRSESARSGEQTPATAEPAIAQAPPAQSVAARTPTVQPVAAQASGDVRAQVPVRALARPAITKQVIGDVELTVCQTPLRATLRATRTLRRHDPRRDDLRRDDLHRDDPRCDGLDRELTTV